MAASFSRRVANRAHLTRARRRRGGGHPAMVIAGVTAQPRSLSRPRWQLRIRRRTSLGRPFATSAANGDSLRVERAEEGAAGAAGAMDPQRVVVSIDAVGLSVARHAANAQRTVAARIEVEASRGQRLRGGTGQRLIVVRPRVRECRSPCDLSRGRRDERQQDLLTLLVVMPSQPAQVDQRTRIAVWRVMIRQVAGGATVEAPVERERGRAHVASQRRRVATRSDRQHEQSDRGESCECRLAVLLRAIGRAERRAALERLESARPRSHCHRGSRHVV